ncbi:hypothetical protein [Aquimarina sp. 2201CG5-10]|uniref:hypothetical protein n=1 Tax=Aquimarina callyspongiae TaxID=3098150 RepID=UPI002AB4DED9|nr:hypothetical protein [Aquimarina sp. 2201CG5-10]MDY8136774.1 hypothetical protein [Aquimarina sp. 2201CG5-10]
MNISNEFLYLLIKIGIGVEILTALVGTIFYHKYKNAPIIKYFIFFLWYVGINELVGLYIRQDDGINAIIYNIYNVINFTFFFALYRHYLDKPKNKKIVLILWIFYLISFVINGFFENYLIKHQKFPYIIAAFFLIITIVLYFIEILNSEKVLYTKKNLLFWVSVGLLLYFVGNIPYRIVRDYYKELADAKILFLARFALTIIMNICFIIGFIWSNKKQQY